MIYCADITSVYTSKMPGGVQAPPPLTAGNRGGQYQRGMSVPGDGRVIYREDHPAVPSRHAGEDRRGVPQRHSYGTEAGGVIPQCHGHPGTEFHGAPQHYSHGREDRFGVPQPYSHPGEDCRGMLQPCSYGREARSGVPQQHGHPGEHCIGVPQHCNHGREDRSGVPQQHSHPGDECRAGVPHHYSQGRDDRRGVPPHFGRSAVHESPFLWSLQLTFLWIISRFHRSGFMTSLSVSVTGSICVGLVNYSEFLYILPRISWLYFGNVRGTSSNMSSSYSAASGTPWPAVLCSIIIRTSLALANGTAVHNAADRCWLRPRHCSTTRPDVFMPDCDPTVLYTDWRPAREWGWREIPAGMEANVAGFSREWKQMLRESCGNGDVILWDSRVNVCSFCPIMSCCNQPLVTFWSC